MFEWLFGKDSVNADETASAGKEPMTRFEVLSTDEKFLDFARILADMSPLDACNHVVIYQLKKRCGDLSEEELGKLSVQLLNCQSEVEQRPIYACTSEMPLVECTKNMDAVTWNTYQIIGNRARAMCYATQQLQFRRLTEKSVNQLAAATAIQLETMEELKQGQEHLHSLATDTVRHLFESQQELLLTHEKLRAGQADVFSSVADNVKQLQQEKALIATGNLQLAQLVEKIREELNLTAKMIQSQEEAQQEKNEHILQDLKQIHSQATEALAKLDNSTAYLLSHHEKLQSQQEEVFQNLRKINSTVMDVMATVIGLQTHMEQRTAWIMHLLAGADDKLEVLKCCVLHLAYFLLLALVAAFLHTPLFIRVLLLLIVVANVAGQLAHQSSLDFAGLTVFITAVIFGQSVLRYMQAVIQKRRSGLTVDGVSAIAGMINYTSESSGTPLTADEVRQLTVLLQRLSHTVQESLGAETVLNGSVRRSSAATTTVHSPPRPDRNLNQLNSASGDTAENLMNVRQRLLQNLAEEDRHSNHSSRASTPSYLQGSRGSSPSLPSSRCLGQTLLGGQCRMSATPGRDYCRRHQPHV